MVDSPEPGYIYLLINYSMPGLVKVGRTARPPSERLDELSGATGVPTPFHLVFDILVPDAPAAEQTLHRMLTDLGYRAADNREFFTAPIHEVVTLMLQLRDQAGRPNLAPRRTTQASQVGNAPLDDLLRAAAEVVIQAGAGSTSVLQRQLSVGYGDAARLIDALHEVGILGPPNGSAPRQVLVRLSDLDDLLPRS